MASAVPGTYFRKVQFLFRTKKKKCLVEITQNRRRMTYNEVYIRSTVLY